MKGNKSNIAMLFIVAVTMFATQLIATSAQAQSSYFTSKGCNGCHTAPVAATCNGCHAHGTHASSSKSGINIAGVTNKTSYAPGETVSVTITGGYRTGWVRAVLYDQNNVELARSTGTASGMGSSTTFPAVLTAAAPAAAGTYSWKVAWYGNVYDTSSGTVGAGFTADPNNPDHGQEVVSMASFTVAAAVDAAAPVVTFTLPATATSLTVPVSGLSATDNVAVTGYLVNTVATPPAASAAGWTATAPTSVTAVAGSNTFYAWAKDAAGNVSAVKSATVVVSLPDTAAPVVTFTLPATATSLTVPVSSLSATDNVAVTGYLVNSVATPPAASVAGWTATAPASVTAVAGSNTFYAWAKDAAGNVSAVKSATVVVTLPDTAAPVVTFTLPATATSLNVAISSLSATDNVAVTGYLVNSVATPPAASAAGWTATAPTSVTAVEGSNTFFAWAKDAAGNVSAVKSASVIVTLPPAADTAAPVVTFTLPATATSFNVAISSLSATDNVAVTGYLVNSVATPPAASAAGWTATAPTSVTAVAGINTFYAWAKDAAGNVSLSKSASVTVTIPPAVDSTPPVVTAFAIPGTSSSLTVPVTAFTAADNVAVTGYLITTSSTAPTAAASGWSATAPASAVAPAAGNVIFFAWAKDAAGNVSLSSSALVNITLPVVDSTPPVVTAFAIPGTSSSLTVPVAAFAAADNVAVTGYLITNSNATPNAAAAGWSATAPANAVATAAGDVIFFAWAKDAAGNVSLSSSALVSITLPGGTDNPLLTVSALNDGAVTNKPTLNVSGSATDPDGIKALTLNDKPLKLKADGSFSAAFKLIPGLNTITVVATDTKGNQSTDARTITYDKAAPLLTVADPSDHSVTADSFITVSGTISETSTVTIVNNGGAVESAAIDGNNFSATLNLVPKLNTLIITATDLAGNKSKVKRSVYYDNVKPALAVTSPRSDITTKKPTLVLKGKVKGTVGDVTVTITLGTSTFTPAVVKGNFSQVLTFASPGTYDITVTATDDSGSSIVERSVIYQPTATEDGDDD